MKKLRIYCNKKQWGPNGTASFPYLFYKLIEKCKGCLWIIYNDCFLLPLWLYEGEAEERYLSEFDSGIICEHKEGYRLVNNDFILKYAEYVRNDWNVLVCYEGDINAFNRVVDETEGDIQKYLGSITNFIAEGREIEGFKFKFYLDNWDTIYWDLASFDEQYINYVKEQLKLDKDVEMEDIEE